MKRAPVALGASLALALGLALSFRILGAGADDDIGALRGEAMAALQFQDGECVVASNPLRPAIDRAALREDARSLGGRTGRVGGVFFGEVTDLAADLAGSIASSGSSTAWILVKDPTLGERAVLQYNKVDLESDGTAWLQAGSMRAIDCSEVVK